MAVIQALNAGRPVEVEYNGKPLLTGIYKQPVPGPLYLGQEQLEGDGQADRVHHGGPDKAVCVYPLEHYAYWESVLGKTMGPAAFGENFTVTGLLEDEVCIGDVYRVGEAVVEVSQPRYPCFKLSQKHGIKELPAQVLATGYSGFYLRVLQEGSVSAGDELIPVQAQPDRISVREVLYAMAGQERRAEVLERILALDRLSEVVRVQLQKLLSKLTSQEQPE